MSAEAPPDAPRRTHFGEAWPLYAFGGLVAFTLVAVYLLLHPQHADAAGAEDAPAFVTADEADLRKEPAPAAAVIARLAEGAKVRVHAESGRWVDVTTDAGARGYLPADAVEREVDRAARQRRAKILLAFAPVFGVVGEDTDIALAPYPLAAHGGRLAKGTIIAIHSVDHSYFAFGDKKWGIAFVDSARVDLVPPDPRAPVIMPEKVRPLADLTVVELSDEPPPEEEAPLDVPAFEVESSPHSPAPAPAAAEIAPGLVEAAAVLTRVEPAYTEPARRAGIEGIVELEVSIDAAGKVTDVEVTRGLPLGLSESAADAVRRWTWRPARAASGPVASRKAVRVRFLLRPEDAR